MTHSRSRPVREFKTMHIPDYHTMKMLLWGACIHISVLFVVLQMKPTEEELARFVGSQMCAEWNTFSVYLGVQKHVRDKVCYNCPRMAEDCFIEVVGRWLSYEDGTGINCRTWETVFSALKGAGYPLLVEEVKQKLSNR